MRICCATWNIQGAEPGYVTEGDIKKWLRSAPKRETARNPYQDAIPNIPVDIYAVGFQEIIPMDNSVRIPVPKIIIKGANNMDLTRASIRDKVLWAWSTLLVTAINRFERSVQYSLYGAYMLNGIGLFIIVRNELISDGHIRNGRADTVRADEKPSDLEVMRLPDNKASGAVGIRFDVGGSSVAFVCCQLHAGDGIGACSERNRQYHKIANEMFKDVGLTLSQHEYVFWIGDLNYKLCQPALGGADSKVAWEFVKRGELDRLLMADELSAQRRNGLAFGEYQEGAPNFSPNYSYKSWLAPGKRRPDKRQITKNHIRINSGDMPAWNERILWRRNTGGVPQPPEFHGGLASYTMPLDVTKISKYLPIVALIDIQISPPKSAVIYSPPPQHQPNVYIQGTQMSPGPLRKMIQAAPNPVPQQQQQIQPWAPLPAAPQQPPIQFQQPQQQQQPQIYQIEAPPESANSVFSNFVLPGM
ncbi:hypothetical protein LSH36_20g07085 [Paralvinella palmiformis]|uniref:Inositol polyphosphate-related phosphatase domain-containing protein n=1 Tax=Paralvinella palmiformis TaxID=53620 RepID=A0AAD9KBK9_9ANNE|nr:hypothetical protein LSH36_20g07085 [Paralvinella palmiformis]